MLDSVDPPLRPEEAVLHGKADSKTPKRRPEARDAELEAPLQGADTVLAVPPLSRKHSWDEDFTGSIAPELGSARILAECFGRCTFVVDTKTPQCICCKGVVGDIPFVT